MVSLRERPPCAEKPPRSPQRWGTGWRARPGFVQFSSAKPREQHAERLSSRPAPKGSQRRRSTIMSSRITPTTCWRRSRPRRKRSTGQRPMATRPLSPASVTCPTRKTRTTGARTEWPDVGITSGSACRSAGAERFPEYHGCLDKKSRRGIGDGSIVGRKDADEGSVGRCSVAARPSPVVLEKLDDSPQR